MPNKKSNPWLVHLNAYRRKHPRLSLSEAMKAARASYRPLKAKVIRGGAMSKPRDRNFKVQPYKEFQTM